MIRFDVSFGHRTRVFSLLAELGVKQGLLVQVLPVQGALMLQFYLAPLQSLLNVLKPNLNPRLVNSLTKLIFKLFLSLYVRAVDGRSHLRRTQVFAQRDIGVHSVCSQKCKFFSCHRLLRL